jgi:hypothetical protein
MADFTQREEEIDKKEEALAVERQILKTKTDLLIQEKTDLRIGDFINYFDLFIATKSKDTQDSVYLHPVLLKSAIISYYGDIHRYKDFFRLKIS